MSRESRKLQKRVKRENRIRLSQHNKMLRTIAKNKLKKIEEKAKVLDQTVDNSI